MASITFLQTAVDTTDSSTYTFASQSLGAAASDRYIIVKVFSRKAGGSTTITDVTVGGVTATIVKQQTTSPANTDVVGIAIALVPTGTTGSVVVTLGATMLRCAIGMYRATEINPVAYDTDGSVASNPTCNLDIPAGGYALGAVTSANSGTTTWTGITETFDAVAESVLLYSGALLGFASLQTGLAITATLSAATEQVGVFASFASVTAPTVTTDSISGIGLRSATANMTIVTAGGLVTTRGVQYNTVQSADKATVEEGAFSAGSFTATLTGLTPGQTYYARAYATNSAGTSYGAWVSFMATPSAYEVSIEGVDRTADVLNETLVISDELNDKQNTCQFRLMNLSGSGIPETDDEIIITLPDGTIIFGGYIVNVAMTPTTKTGAVGAIINCVDYVRLFDRNLVNKGYTDMTDAEIIADIISTYCPGFGITGTNVVEGVTIDQINFNYVQPSQAMRRICDLTGRNWYIDYEKDIHYFPMLTNVAPFNITDSQDIDEDYSNLTISKDASQIKNRVYVRGGTRLSDATYHETKGDGVMRKFVLPDKPHDVVVKVNSVVKTLGIKNIDTSGFDYYLNFQEKYVEQDSGAVVLATTDTLRVEYTYDLPILVAVEDTASIAANGQREFPIFDKTITTQQAARDRASAELTDYANNLIEGTFRTFVDGFRTGQYMTINLTDYDVNAQYLVQKVVAHSFGAGKYYYDVSIASAKTMGIIRFLIELLEANNKLVELNDDEVVDNLLSIADSLNPDSLTDLLTIDSAGPYATWCTDSLTATATRARWDLFGWG